MKQAFEGEFPKLLRLLCDLWSRLSQFFSESALNAETNQTLLDAGSGDVQLTETELVLLSQSHI